MARIVNPNEILSKEVEDSNSKIAESLHDYTFGITSDPLTQFACVLSALIVSTSLVYDCIYTPQRRASRSI